MLLGYNYNEFIVNFFLKHSNQKKHLCLKHTYQEDLLDTLKSQIWGNSQFKEFLLVDSTRKYAVFYTQYRSQETLCKWGLL